MNKQKVRMSSVDTAWWHMEEPTNLMTITTLMVFGGRPNYEQMIQTIAARLLRFDRFRQRVVEPLAPWSATRWELDPTFDLAAHIHRVALPEPRDQAALERLVSDLLSTPLDYTKPLWQMHIVEQFGDDENFAVVTRFHHCLADGVALMRLLLSLTDSSPDAEPPPMPDLQPRKTPNGLLRRVTAPVGGLVKSTAGVTESAVNLTVEGARASMDLLLDPSKALDAARFATSFVSRFGKMTLRWPDPSTIYKGELGSQKRVAWSVPADLATVKMAAHGFGGTINDLMVAAVSGGLRRYMEDHGINTADLDFRAYIPVNMRPQDEAIELGNAFGLVFLSLPVGIVDRRQRFQVVHLRMEELKDSPEAAVSITVLGIGGLLPKELEATAFRFYHAKATAVLTNVPGPQEQLYFAGQPLKYMMGWVPQSGNLGLGISIISYNGEIMCGINTDAGLVPDPETIVRYTEEELGHYLQATAA
jgi:diacylglycerol O-acyltransferase